MLRGRVTATSRKIGALSTHFQRGDGGLAAGRVGEGCPRHGRWAFLAWLIDGYGLASSMENSKRLGTLIMAFRANTRY